MNVCNWALDSGTPIRTPKKNGVQPLHAALERRAEAARHLHAFNRRAYGVRPCQTGVQSLHACLEGVQSLHALRTGVKALHACWLTNPPPSTRIRKPTTGHAQRLLNGPTTAVLRTPIRTPKKNGVQPLHAASERRAEAARPSPQAARHLHAFNRRAYGVRPCQTGVQSLHACLEGVQSLHALWTGVQALHACRLTLSNREAYVSQPRPVPLELTWARVQKPATKFNHPDPQANDRPRPTDTHQTQPSR
ncbi:hypothetical protein PCASD_25103 [Puccinia coronata f. sp. avenae]|uniref:Uncharacterized protein n=1 Tax=Puccinia coronata f. sp. avenae TaxID=200324 RepID=A0A2N5TMX0_9BASI|nr:hypothetical protein PCASD_25103 [Puccinia coronata f. sp. avenae]